MTERNAAVSVHRFADSVALAVLRSAGTVYMEPRDARAVAAALSLAAASVDGERFTDSRVGSTQVPAFPQSGLAPRVDRDADRPRFDLFADMIAAALFPDEFHDGRDCRDESGRPGEPCRTCGEQADAWNARREQVAAALASVQEFLASQAHKGAALPHDMRPEVWAALAPEERAARYGGRFAVSAVNGIWGELCDYRGAAMARGMGLLP